jgi:hypothetical protein
MLLLARGEFTPGSSADPDLEEEQRWRLAEFRELMTRRPLIFVGYGIPEVDVDVVYALQQFRDRRTPPSRRQLAARRALSPAEIERLRQLGVEPWAFDVANVGFASGPGRLQSARRHEWRLTAANPLDVPPDRDWRRALERVGSQAWLEPQLQALRSLDPDRPAGVADSRLGGSRLVVAGLASVWHGIALTKPGDFPTPRRVSAQLIAVDARVPGGSGLVPVMIAAAAAGPAQAGSVAFFSNAPRQWANWDEIEKFCLTAGVSVHPWTPPAGTATAEAPVVGRTSHVILFDPDRDDTRSSQPRQRFIMDVQDLADDAPSAQVTNWSSLKVPPATVPGSFQSSGREDFLFTDKECDPSVLAGWKGPTVYETGASGDELVTRLGPLGVRPTIWTAGVGSFLRTLVALAGLVPGEAAYARGPQGVLDHIASDGRLAALADCEDLRERYLAKLISFQRPGIWDHGGVEGFSYKDELEYGIWLRDRWLALAEPIGELLEIGTANVLSQPHPKVGGGVLTTVHEAGLMAVWRWPNTLAAGDTVRGAMAFGLWSAAYQSSQPANIRKILLASAALASTKCYAGSFVDFLRILEHMRGTPVWHLMWD